MCAAPNRACMSKPMDKSTYTVSTFNNHSTPQPKFSYALPSLIMSSGKATTAMLRAFLLKNNPKLKSSYVNDLIVIYSEESRAEGVNLDIAFCQMCHETDFLRYGNQVKANQNNFAGIGATDDGAHGAKFPSIRIGVRAQIQHLKAYASKESLHFPLVDPRFPLVTRGCAPTLEMLTSRWGTDPLYHKKIQAKLIKLYSLF